MEITEYRWPFEEAKTQYAIDTLIYDEPWKLWRFTSGLGNHTYEQPLFRKPSFNNPDVIYRRTTRPRCESP